MKEDLIITGDRKIDQYLAAGEYWASTVNIGNVASSVMELHSLVVETDTLERRSIPADLLELLISEGKVELLDS